MSAKHLSDFLKPAVQQSVFFVQKVIAYGSASGKIFGAAKTVRGRVALDIMYEDFVAADCGHAEVQKWLRAYGWVLLPEQQQHISAAVKLFVREQRAALVGHLALTAGGIAEASN